jgi:hypothetical protein
MTLREDVYARCTGHAGLAAIFGTRWYPDQLPENVTYPAGCFKLPISADNSTYRTHDGATSREVTRIQFESFADTGDAAAAGADQLRDAWDGYSDDCTFGYCWQANRLHSVESRLKSGSSAQVIHREIVDVMVEHSV